MEKNDISKILKKPSNCIQRWEREGMLYILLCKLKDLERNSLDYSREILLLFRRDPIMPLGCQGTLIIIASVGWPQWRTIPWFKLEVAPRFMCLLLYLKQNKQEIRKRIQAKILGVSIGYEQSNKEQNSELCVLLLWNIALKYISILWSWIFGMIRTENILMMWGQQGDSLEDFIISLILNLILL